MDLENIGVTKAKINQFNKKGIYSVEDMIEFFPRKYNDFSKLTGIVSSDEASCIIMKVQNVRLYENSKTPLIIASGIEKGTGKKIKVMWFRKKYIFSSIYSCIDKEVYACGKATYNGEYDNYTISEPNVFSPNVNGAQKIYPVYSKISGMSEDYLNEHMLDALNQEMLLDELLPRDLIKKENLYSFKESIRELHNPTNMENLHKAQDRMIFDDLLYFAMRMEQNNRQHAGGSCYNITSLKNYYNIINSLPYDLTEDQKNTVESIIKQMRTGKVRGLVQGNVGSGKTLVAELCMIAMSDSGYQSLLVAPTKILAKQHYEDMKNLIEPYGLNVAFYQGTQMPARERKDMLEKIKSGYYNFVIGTNGVLGKNVEFNNLGLAILDEEHKYGSCLKESVYAKSTNSLHTILMSATPIPRSIATVLYGDDIQLYNITTMPSNRKPIQTYISNIKRDVFNFLYKQIKMGHQAYVVCPIIDQSEKLENVASIEEMSVIYKEAFEPLGISVGVLTGRNTKEEAEIIIQKYQNKEYDMLLCSQIIEVGISNSNSTVMVIHSPDRLGLASLHQIRGRVGRGQYQSYCILYTDDIENERLKVLASTTNGYEIALYDLKNRKTGDLIGTQQSGENKYVELMLSHQELYMHLKEIASQLLDTGEGDIFLNKKIQQNENDVKNEKE